MSDVNSLCRLHGGFFPPCRLCSAEVKEDGLSIFGDRGRESFVQSKIKLYLHILVTENDDLPNFLCSSCFGTLESIHKFASMALCMQKHLRSHLGLQALQSSDVPSPHTLLHSVQYLPSDQSSEVEPEEEKYEVETDCEVMEMEINPMSILYPGDENSDPADEKSEEDEESDLPKMSRKKRLSPEERKPYVCIHCSRRFVLELSLQNHLWLHKDKSRPRPKLGRTRKNHLSRLNNNYSPESNRKGRMKEGEEEVSILETEEMDLKTEETEEESSKIKVEKTEKEGVENSLCGVCRKNFESQSELKTHLIEHHVEGKFGCCICSRVFRSKEGLEQHEANHKLRDYTCNQCGRVYSSKSSLSSHLVTHSDVRPHKCVLCPKTFKRNQDLKFHMNQHTGERPYLCPYCPKAFASSGNCFSHRKRMHRREMQQAKVPAVDTNAQE